MYSYHVLPAQRKGGGQTESQEGPPAISLLTFPRPQHLSIPILSSPGLYLPYAIILTFQVEWTIIILPF